MNLLSSIWKNRFSFYIIIYFFVLFLIIFFLYSYWLIWNNTIQYENISISLYSLVFLFVILFILLFKRIRDIKKISLILLWLYIIPIIAFYFIGIYMWVMNIFLVSIFVLLFNPFFPLILIFILSFKRWNIEEDFNLQFITNKIFWALFFNKNLKNKIIKNRFIIWVYKYLFFVFLFWIFVVFVWNQDTLFNYKWYDNYSSKYWLKSDLFDKYSKENKIITQYEEYDKNHSRWENDKNPVRYEDYSSEKYKLENIINIELNNNKNGLNKEIYFIVILYFIVWFIIYKILPIILYFIKVPLSIIYLYIKKSFSKLEDIEKKLKK